MIDLREINETIEDLRRDGTSIKDAERLGILYNLREHFMREEADAQTQIQAYSFAAEPAEPESEFQAACAGLSVAQVVDALEDTIQGLQIVAPKAYAAAIRRLKSIKNG